MGSMITYRSATVDLTIAQKVGQLFMPAAFINDSEEEIQALENLIRKHHIGSLCFFHSRASAATNFEGKKVVVYNENSLETLKRLIKRYQAAAKYPLLITIDAEWGLAMRIENTPQYPYAITLGALQNHDELIYQVGKQIAKDCREAGIHWNLSPVADINTNPNNPVIGYRSFGENKIKVVQKAAAFIHGTQSEGILCSIKHFPGHGDTATDSHLGLPVIQKSKESLSKNELYPFQKLIKSGIDSVMVGHLAVPSLTNREAIPATISKTIIQGVLRKELGFKGVVISDALNMHSVAKMFPRKGELEWLAFDAGNDVLCFAENIPEGIEYILNKATENDIENSFERVWQLKEKAITTSKKQNENGMPPEDLNRAIALESITVFHHKENYSSDFIRSGFTGISVGKSKENPFFKTIAEVVNFNGFSTTTDTFDLINSGIQENENVLIALFPPKVKPQNNFELSDQELKCINDLIQTKKVTLYLFGNPYVLNLINLKKTNKLVVVYQDFPVFQETAAKHFLGKITAPGILPVTISKNESV